MFMKIVDGSARLSKSAKSISEEADKLTTTESSPIKVGSLKALLIDGKVPEGSKMVTNYAYVTTVIDAFMKDPSKATTFINHLMHISGMIEGDNTATSLLESSVMDLQKLQFMKISQKNF